MTIWTKSRLIFCVFNSINWEGKENNRRLHCKNFGVFKAKVCFSNLEFIFFSVVTKRIFVQIGHISKEVTLCSIA